MQNYGDFLCELRAQFDECDPEMKTRLEVPSGKLGIPNKATSLETYRKEIVKLATLETKFVRYLETVLLEEQGEFKTETKTMEEKEKTIQKKTPAQGSLAIFGKTLDYPPFGLQRINSVTRRSTRKATSGNPQNIIRDRDRKSVRNCKTSFLPLSSTLKGQLPRPSKTPTRCLVYCWTGKRDATKIGKTLSKK